MVIFVLSVYGISRGWHVRRSIALNFAGDYISWQPVASENADRRYMHERLFINYFSLVPVRTTRRENIIILHKSSRNTKRKTFFFFFFSFISKEKNCINHIFIIYLNTFRFRLYFDLYIFYNSFSSCCRVRIFYNCIVCLYDYLQKRQDSIRDSSVIPISLKVTCIKVIVFDLSQ